MRLGGKAALRVLRASLGAIVSLCIGAFAPWVSAGTAELSWIPPTQNTDGSPLTDLASYRAYWGCGVESGYPHSTLIEPPLPSVSLSGLPDDTECRFVVVAINSRGIASEFSAEARKRMPPGAVPAAPRAGPVIGWQVSVMADYVDNFNRADGNLAGSTSSDTQFTWSEPGGGGLVVDSNQLASGGGASTGFHTAVASAEADTDDMYVELSIVALGTANVGIHLGSSSDFGHSSTTGSGYGFELTDPSTGAWRIYRQSTDATIDSGTQANLASPPYTLRMERISNVIKVYRDGVQLTGAEVTNSAESSGSGNRHAGVTYFGDGNSGLEADNFGYGDVDAGGGEVALSIAAIMQNYRNMGLLH